MKSSVVEVVTYAMESEYIIFWLHHKFNFFSSVLLCPDSSHLLHHLRHSRFLSSSASGLRARADDKSPADFHLLLLLPHSALHILSHEEETCTVQSGQTSAGHSLVSGVKAFEFTWFWEMMGVQWSLSFPSNWWPSLQMVTVHLSTRLKYSVDCF